MSITEYDLTYLLKEMDNQFEIESKARDRAEQMVQYLLTTLAAIIAGTLILVQVYSLQVLFLFASLLIFIFSVTSFYRTCRLRTIITQTRLARHLIRFELEAGEVKHAFLLGGIDQELTGFSNRMVSSLRLFAFTCGVLGGLVFYLGGIYLVEEFDLFPQIYEMRTIIFGFFAVVVIFGTNYVLNRVINNFKQISEKLLQAHDIRREGRNKEGIVS